MSTNNRWLRYASATALATLVMILVMGCDRSPPKYKVGEVYSITEPTLPAPTFRTVKVIDVQGSKLVLSFAGNWAPQRPVSVAQFSTNSPPNFLNLSMREFEKKAPALLGTLPLTPQDTNHLNKPKFP